MFLYFLGRNSDRSAASRQLAFPSTFSSTANDSSHSGSAGLAPGNPPPHAPIAPSMDPNLGYFQLADPTLLAGQQYSWTTQASNYEQFVQCQDHLTQVNAMQVYDTGRMNPSAVPYPSPVHLLASGGVVDQQPMVLDHCLSLQNFQANDMLGVDGNPVHHSTFGSIPSHLLPTEMNRFHGHVQERISSTDEPFDPGRLYASPAQGHHKVKVIC